MWANITVGKYQQIYDILQGQNFEHAVDRQIQLLACLDDRPAEYYEGLPLQELLRDHVPRVSFLTDEPPVVPNPPKYLHANGRRYKVVYDFRDLCAGQFIDMMSIAKTPEEIVMDVNKLLAVLCLPVEKGWLKKAKTRQYGYIPFDEVADDMLQVPICEAMAVAGFFSEAWNRFLEVIPGYLRRRTQRTAKMPTETEMVIYEIALAHAGGGS
jgi:hypothetical protein